MQPAVGIAGLGALLVLVAGTFDAEQLYVPGAGFIMLAGAAAAWVAIASRGLRVDRTLGARRVVEDEPLEVRVRVRAGAVGLPGGVVEDPLLPEPARLPFGRRGGRLRIHARFERRGRRALEPVRVVVRDPLGLASRAVDGVHGDEVLVLPRTEPVRRLRRPAGNGRAHHKGRPAMAAEVELDGVREHRPGTPASRIYWPALARGAGLMERRLRADADATPLVVLDARGSGEDTDGLDAAVRAAASLALAMAREGSVAVLLPGDRRPTVLDSTLAGWSHLHARLALVTPGVRTVLTNVAARAGPVLYVSGVVTNRVPRALEHAPAAGRVLVVPGTLPGRAAVFTVCGCTGYDLAPSRAQRGAAA